MDTSSSAYLLIFRESTPERYRAMSAEQRRQALRGRGPTGVTHWRRRGGSSTGIH